jgi:prepilin-type processing-associated H-X9-DG protein
MGLGIMMYAGDYDDVLCYNAHPCCITNFPAYATGDTSKANWIVQIIPYIKNSQIFECPSATNSWGGTIPSGSGNIPAATNYVWNGRASGDPLAKLKWVAEYPLITEWASCDPNAYMRPTNCCCCDADWSWLQGAPYNSVPSYWGVNHGATGGPTTEPGIYNVTFADGHAKAMNPTRLWTVIWLKRVGTGRPR